jgi:hypothetical protein
MQPNRFVHWQEGEFWLGYLEELPDYWTQGTSRDDLIVHLIGAGLFLGMALDVLVG